MKTQTTKEQLDGLVLILTVMLNENSPKDIAEDLVYEHVVTAYNKLRVRSEKNAPRDRYKVSLTDQEARALFLFIQSVYVSDVLYPFETIQIQLLSDQIHHKYAKVKRIGQAPQSLSKKIAGRTPAISTADTVSGVNGGS